MRLLGILEVLYDMVKVFLVGVGLLGDPLLETADLWVGGHAGVVTEAAKWHLFRVKVVWWEVRYGAEGILSSRAWSGLLAPLGLTTREPSPGVRVPPTSWPMPFSLRARVLRSFSVVGCCFARLCTPRETSVASTDESPRNSMPQRRRLVSCPYVIYP